MRRWGTNSPSLTVVQKENPKPPHKTRQNTHTKDQPSLFHPLEVLLLTYCLFFCCFFFLLTNYKSYEDCDFIFKLLVLCASLAAQGRVLLMDYKGWELLEPQLLSLGKCLTVTAHFCFPSFPYIFSLTVCLIFPAHPPLSHHEGRSPTAALPLVERSPQHPWGRTVGRRWLGLRCCVARCPPLVLLLLLAANKPCLLHFVPVWWMACSESPSPAQLAAFRKEQSWRSQPLGCRWDPSCSRCCSPRSVHSPGLRCCVCC